MLAVLLIPPGYEMSVCCCVRGILCLRSRFRLIMVSYITFAFRQNIRQIPAFGTIAIQGIFEITPRPVKRSIRLETNKLAGSTISRIHVFDFVTHIHAKVSIRFWLSCKNCRKRIPQFKVFHHGTKTITTYFSFDRIYHAHDIIPGE